MTVGALREETLPSMFLSFVVALRFGDMLFVAGLGSTCVLPLSCVWVYWCLVFLSCSFYFSGNKMIP